MMRSLNIGLCLALLGCVLGGCTGSQTADTPVPALSKVEEATRATGFPLTITDDLQRRVTFLEAPRRIVCLSSAHTETLYALGVGDRIIAADTYSDYPPEVREKATLECWPRAPLEQMVALQPDLVLVLTQGHQELKDMENAGLTALQLFPKSYEAALETILTLGQIVGEEPRARELVASLRERTEAVRKQLTGVQPTPVFLELDAVDPGRPFVAGGAGLYHEILTLAGGQNLFADLPQPAAQVSAEQIIARNPQVILLGDADFPEHPQTPELVRRRPGWNTLAAVKNGRIYVVESVRITRPGPRMVEGLEEVARYLHPDRVK